MLIVNRRKKPGARFGEIKVDVSPLYETMFCLIVSAFDCFCRYFEGSRQQPLFIIIICAYSNLVQLTVHNIIAITVYFFFSTDNDKLKYGNTQIFVDSLILEVNKDWGIFP